MNESSLQPDSAVDPLDREYAPGWRPAEGEIVRGTVVGVDLGSRDHDYGGGRYPIVTLRLAPGFAATIKDGTTSEEVALHAIHSQLAGKLAAIEPKIGDAIGVKYVGEPLGSARAKRYRVDRSTDGGGAPSAEVAWAEFRFADADASPRVTSPNAPLTPSDRDESEAATEAALERERDELDAADDGDIPF